MAGAPFTATLFNCEDVATKKQESLRARDRDEAFRLVAAKNETHEGPAFSRQLARVYWKAGDPVAAKRDWQTAMDELIELKHGANQRRWQTAVREKSFDTLRTLPILETRSEHFLRVLHAGSLSTNVYLRRLHNFALDMDWLPWPVLPKRQWPPSRARPRGRPFARSAFANVWNLFMRAGFPRGRGKQRPGRALSLSVSEFGLKDTASFCNGFARQARNSTLSARSRQVLFNSY